jgi:hypothetical protein
MHCPLCCLDKNKLYFFDENKKWQYYQCEICHYVFRDHNSLLVPDEEYKRYSTHENSIENKGYVDFLMPVIDRLLPFLSKEDVGLDFGCGPGPILDILFHKKGIQVFNYDPFFKKETDLLKRHYNFIACTEAFEHFYHPQKELDLMSEILKPKGYLLIMTEFLPQSNDFSKWYYRKDPTHVGFLNEQSLIWLAKRWDFEIITSNQARISILRKNN